MPQFKNGVSAPGRRLCHGRLGHELDLYSLQLNLGLRAQTLHDGQQQRQLVVVNKVNPLIALPAILIANLACCLGSSQAAHGNDNRLGTLDLAYVNDVGQDLTDKKRQLSIYL